MIIRYSVYERSPEGRLVTPWISEGYGFKSHPDNPYEEKDASMRWIKEALVTEPFATYVILEEYSNE